MIGESILQYNIIEKLGEGGMGIVYKALDTKLNRPVALKFLPSHFSEAEKDKERFTIEAQAAASLSHANICTIFGIEEVEGKQFIVMEYVDGQTLQEKKKNIPFKQALEIGIQIADGLSAAHEKAIVHRDIKPENIMIKKDGTVQIMDFGLAKLRGASRLTRAGATVGTVGYMSPEQVQGLDVDHRTDIFSLGVLLYELFAGQSPFNGVHETAIIYEIVNVDPKPIGTLKSEIDAELDAIVLECLAKDPADRYQSAAEVARNLRRVKRESSRSRISRMSGSGAIFMPSERVSATSKSFSRKQFIPWIAAGACLVIALLFAWLYLIKSSPTLQEVRLEILPPGGAEFRTQYGGHVAISPDGSMIAFVAIDSNRTSVIYLRMMNEVTARKLPGTEGGRRPFWSPDSRWIGFETGTKLMKIDIIGGSPLTICDVVQFQGASWNSSGQIVYNGFESSSGLWVISANGGIPKPIMGADTTTISSQIGSSRWPWFLPDGDHFLFSVASVGDESIPGKIMVGSLSSNEAKKLLDVRSNAQYADGFIYYCRDNKIIAHPFNVSTLELTGDPMPVTERPTYDHARFKADFSVSSNGTIVQSNSRLNSSAVTSFVSWFDRDGKALPGQQLLGEFVEVRLSPDQKKLALTEGTEGAYDIWTYDLSRNVKSRLTFESAAERFPTWSPDAKTIYYSAFHDGALSMYRKDAGGLGLPEKVYRSDMRARSVQVTQDGRYLLFLLLKKTLTDDIFAIPLQGDPTPVTVAEDAFDKEWPSFSPDGRWVAYSSNETGIYQVYIVPFPQNGSRWQLSSGKDNVEFIRWRGDGKELFFVSGGQMMSVSVEEKGKVLLPGTPQVLFPNPFSITPMSWDVSRDGKSFVGIQSGVVSHLNDPLLVVLNLKRPVR